MTEEVQNDFFIGKSRGADGIEQTSVFYAPRTSGLTIATEAIRVKIINNPNVGQLWTPQSAKLVLPGTECLPISDQDIAEPSILPSSLTEVGRSLDEALRTEDGGAVWVYDGAPEEIKDLYDKVETSIAEGHPDTDLFAFLGIEIEPVEERPPLREPSVGQYL